MPTSSPQVKIDTHHHFVPDFYRKGKTSFLLHPIQLRLHILIKLAVENAGGDPSGFPTPEWTPESDQAAMTTNGIRTSILSITSPGPVIAGSDAAARTLARQAIEYAASLRDKNPSQYGFFAAMPNLLDTEGSLAEIKHALDVLNADGVTLFTRYGVKNQYLGHPEYDPIWEELNARHAVVFIHPTHPIDPHRVNHLFAQSNVDYPHETSRAAVDWISTGAKRRFSNCKVVLSHAGGTLPWLISRVAPARRDTESYEEWMEDFRSFYFDLALSSSPLILSALLSAVPHDRVLYGMHATKQLSLSAALLIHWI